MKRSLVIIFLLLITTAVGNASPKGGEIPGGVYRDLELFSKALYHVQKDYVESPDSKKLMFGAIGGMMSALDPHSMFLPPELYKELKVDTQGWFGGIGIEITVKDDYVTVVAPIDGSPAARAGIQPGDRIVKINGHSVRGQTLSETVETMRGPRGSKMTLTLLPQGSKTPRDVTVQRDIIRIKSVRAELPEPGYAYLKINSFQDGTTKEMDKALKGLEKKSGGELKGLIMDLRNNPGGLLEEAVEMSDKFLEKGLIVTTASRGKEIDRRVAHAEGTYPNFPIVIVVNGGSASAAEIVSAALQDNHRATLLGAKTFGKGSVQTIFELGNGAAIKLTIAKYFTPNGRSIQGQGILPDIVVKPEKGKTTGENTRTDDTEKISSDPQIKMALEVLQKGKTSSRPGRSRHYSTAAGSPQSPPASHD